MFGWKVVRETPLPVVFRGETPYVATRIVLIEIVKSYKSFIPKEALDGLFLPKEKVLPSEITLLNEINGFHCKNKYGGKFKTNSTLLNFEEIEKLVHFLDYSKNIFLNGMKFTEGKKYGFYKLSIGKIIPYVDRDFDKYIAASHCPLTQCNEQENSFMEHWEANYIRMLSVFAKLETKGIVPHGELLKLSLCCN